jgi:hypothetical protein
MTERELLVDCLHRLNRTGVVYYLTDSMASNYWGIPRTIHDLDFSHTPATAVPLLFMVHGDFYIRRPRSVRSTNHRINSTPSTRARR